MQRPVGIDLISFHTPAYFLALDTLAGVRGADPAKYHIGIGQDRMAIPPPDQDIVTLAANAAEPLLAKSGRENISHLLFATESCIDLSKAAALFCHGLLGLPARCRCVELKEACYAGTAALKLACEVVRAHPEERVLVLASDVARYDLGSPGEPTQGAGAVAMLVSADPRVFAIEPECGFHAEDIMDFWRPTYRTEALVEGKYSTRMYLSTLRSAWDGYKAASGRGLADHARFCFHLPFTKIAFKAFDRLCRFEGVPAPDMDAQEALLAPATRYNRLTGNTYAACLYESLCSLLDTAEEDLSGKRVGMFSYGSGCMAEYFSGLVVPGYREHLFAAAHRQMLEERTELTYRQYEDIYTYGIPQDGDSHLMAPYRSGPFRLAGLENHKRRYERAD